MHHDSKLSCSICLPLIIQILWSISLREHKKNCALIILTHLWLPLKILSVKDSEPQEELETGVTEQTLGCIHLAFISNDIWQSMHVFIGLLCFIFPPENNNWPLNSSSCCFSAWFKGTYVVIYEEEEIFLIDSAKPDVSLSCSDFNSWLELTMPGYSNCCHLLSALL